MSKGYDVRTVANVVLLHSRLLGLSVTNLHLNKILYFMHVDHLRDFQRPLVSAKIEAWEYGPVFREVYNQFKGFRRQPIVTLAQRVNYDTGQFEDSVDPLPSDLLDYLRKLSEFYLHTPSSVLVDLSHAKGGAWDKVWSSGTSFNAGMEITEDIIRECELAKPRRIRVI